VSSHLTTLPPAAPAPLPASTQTDWVALASVLWSRKWLVLGLPLLLAALAVGASFLVAPTFTARTTILPPQPPQSAAAAALASLGGLAGLMGGASAVRTPADQYVALMQSESISDRLIERFGLLGIYNVRYRADARKLLALNSRMTVGKKDGLIAVEVDDEDPRRAAEMANQFVEELRVVTGRIAVTEARQRRVFFETLLSDTRDKLSAAQQALQGSGFNSGAIKAEPKTAAESYARLRAEFTAAEVRLEALRRSFAESAPEVQQQVTVLAALRSQLARLESAVPAGRDADYVSRYREFKYQETLFDLFARQYELARVDESREGLLIQVVDPATTPEKKSRPKRMLVALFAWLAATVLLVAWILGRHHWRLATAPVGSATIPSRSGVTTPSRPPGE
jgi:uncharacterized protein involved in exopolysaccharide biosynthesis